MRRKLALINSSEGPWVHTGDFSQPAVRVHVPPGTVVAIAGVNASDPHGAAGWMKRITEAGIHRLDPALWMRAVVLEGLFEGVHCIFAEVG